MTPHRLQSRFQGWETPEYISSAIEKCFDGSIELDAASNPRNPIRAKRYFTKSGLTSKWVDRTFVNPPYSHMHAWLGKLREEAHRPGCHRIAALLPCGTRFSTKYFQRDVLSLPLTAVVFLNKRIAFQDSRTGEVKPNNLYDSAIWFYNTRIQNVAESFRGLGRCIEMSVWA